MKINTLLYFFKNDHIGGEVDFFALHRAWMGVIALRDNKKDSTQIYQDINDLLGYIILHCFTKDAPIEARLVSNILKTEQEHRILDSGDQEKVILPLLTACTSFQRKSIDRPKLMDKISRVANTADEMRKVAARPVLFGQQKFEARMIVLRELSNACKTACTSFSDSSELEPKVLPIAEEQQNSYVRPAATAPLPPPSYAPPPYTPPQGQPLPPSQQSQTGYLVDTTGNAQAHGNPPLSSSHPNSNAQNEEILKLSALNIKDKNRREKQAISDMFGVDEPALPVTPKRILTQDSVLLKLKARGIDGLSLSSEGLDENSTLRIAQVSDNAFLDNDNLSRLAVDARHRRSPFSSTNPLIAYKKAPAGTVNQIRVSYDGRVVPYNTFLSAILNDQFNKRRDRTFNCPADGEQAVFLNAVLLKDERKDYQNDQQGKAKYKVECTSSHARSQSLPEKYSFGRIALELNSDGTYSMVKDGFVLMSMNRSKDEQYFFGKDLYETTGISDAAFLALSQSEDSSQRDLSNRIKKDQLLVITFNLIPQRAQHQWGRAT